MHQQAALVSHRSFTRSGWCGGWLAVPLALMLMLVSAFSAHAHPTSSSPTNTAIESITASLQVPAPHCEHGHGWEHASAAMLRAERQDVSDVAVSLPTFAVAFPRVENTIGSPGEAPTLASLPIYLLTQRLRP
ncbi:TrbC/VirB2 family protein [Billgrantia bachuensis]|uniref:TrbC/VirB2 family protein n=1 Tax=Billgrantia bachuensis TaxID=2717286 RepID=A0ABX0PX11_9GAMM|nr:TrbC/VirB2 family protein [Halomonas bachuensis]NIC07484.1 TrbC/VirB2 family protein [Halomonas bachuensis]